MQMRFILKPPNYYKNRWLPDLAPEQLLFLKVISTPESCHAAFTVDVSVSQISELLVS